VKKEEKDDDDEKERKKERKNRAFTVITIERPRRFTRSRS